MSVPVVPLPAFQNLAGLSLAEDVRRLISDRSLAALVLFSDTLGEQLALLPLGPGQRYGKLEETDGLEIEGLRPLCALRLREDEKAGEIEGRLKELDRLEESLRSRERYLAECEQRMAAVGQALSEREAMIEQREQMLLEKEQGFFRRGGELTRRAEDTGFDQRTPASARA